MAPYRVNLFKELSSYVELTVCFEKKNDSSRNSEWFEKSINNFEFIALKNWDKPKKVKFEILKYLKKEKYDYVIAFEYSTHTASLMLTACRLKRIPYLINCDGAFINPHPLKDKVKRLLVANARACLANGENAKNYFLHYGARLNNIYQHNFSSFYKNEILSRPVTAEMKKEMKRSFGLPAKKIAMTVGQFIYRKGFDVLLKAWRMVDTEHVLLIIGEGEKEQEYREFIKEYAIDNVIIIGFKKKNELFNYYKASDLFVLPTREDIWGLVINEAMACGLPVITTDKCIAGVELIENGENGYLVKADDEEELAQRLNLLLKNEEITKKMAENNIEKIQKYTYENNALSNYETLTKISANHMTSNK